MIDSFAGGPPTALDRAGPIQNQEFSVPNVKTGKYRSDIYRDDEVRSLQFEVFGINVWI